MIKKLFKKRDPWYGPDSPKEGALQAVFTLASVAFSGFVLFQVLDALGQMDISSQYNEHEPSWASWE